MFGLVVDGVASATPTDLANVVVTKRHSEICISPFGWMLAFVSLTGSPWTAWISAVVSRTHASLRLADAAVSLNSAFSKEGLGVWLAGSPIAHREKPQNTIRGAN